MSTSRQRGGDVGGPLSSSGDQPVCSAISNDRLRNATSNVLLGLANDMLQSSTPHHQTGPSGVPAVPSLDQESSAASGRTGHRHQPPARGMMYPRTKPSATRSALVPERRIAATKRSADQDSKPHGGGGRKKTKKCSDKRWTKRYVSARII